MSICQVTPSPPPQGAVYTIQWSDCKHGAKQFWHSLRLPDLIFCCRFAFPEEVMLSEMKGIECVQSAGQTVWKHWQNTTIQPLYNQNWTLCVLRIGVILPAPPSVKSQCSKVAWGAQGVFLAWRRTWRLRSEYFCTEDESAAASVALLSRSRGCSHLVLLLPWQNFESVLKPPRARARAMPRWMSHWAQQRIFQFESRWDRLAHVTVPLSATSQRQTAWMCSWKVHAAGEHGYTMGPWCLAVTRDEFGQLLKLKLRRETLHSRCWMCPVIASEAWGEHGRLKVELNLLQRPRPPVNPIIWHPRGTHVSKSCHYKANGK